MPRRRTLAQRQEEREEKIRFTTARLMQNQIDSTGTGVLTIYGNRFAQIEPEWPVSEDSSKAADIVVLRPGNRAVFVIETKRIADNGRITYNISPYSPRVRKQAKEYALALNIEYYATFNGRHFVAFKVIEQDDSLDNPILSLEVIDLHSFASNLLTTIAKIITNRIKPIITTDFYSDQLKSFFNLISPQYHESFIDKINYEKSNRTTDFYDKLEAHMKKIYRSIDNKKDLEIMSREATYILIDKLLFYQLLSKTRGYHLTSLQLIAHKPDFLKELRFLFQSVVDEINFGPIFSSSELFTTDINDGVANIKDYDEKYDISIENFKDDIIDFIIVLQRMDLSNFDATQLGYIFEKVISIEERRELGQYYTPKPIIELINRLTIKKHNALIFDPACGSGGFLVGAYNILKELKDQSSISYNHITLLKQIKGNDIRRFPTHLSAISLAIQELKLITHEVKIVNEDFFHLFGKSFKRFASKISTADKAKVENAVIVPENFDAIVMNPPYIRQEKIDKDLVSWHLTIKPLESIISKKPSLTLSKQADIYCYFITHAWDFLKEGGRVGLIISDRWLDTRYGEQFQKFLLRLYKIEALITIDKQAFEEPLVGSLIAILQKCSNEEIRNNNIIKFFRLKKKKTILETVQLLTNNNQQTDIDNDEYKLFHFKQQILEDQSKWTIFLFFDIKLFCFFNYLPRLVNIEKFCEIKRGITSGANDFFFRKYSELNPNVVEYFTPLLKSLGQVDRIQFSEEEPEWGILNIKNIMEPLLEQFKTDFNEALKEEPPRMLNKSKYVRDYLINHHPDLVDYIREGISEKYNNGVTVKAREFWYYLSNIEPYEMCLSMFYWRVFINPIKTDVDYAIADQLTYITLKNQDYSKLMAAWINSNLIKFFIEILSRKAKGEALDRLQLKIYEAKSLPCLDFDNMSDSEKKNIENTWDEFLEIDKDVNLRNENPTDKEKAVIDQWELKKQEIDILFLKFLFPIEIIKNREIDEENEINLFSKKCYLFYKELMDQILNDYDENNYNDLLKYLLKLILDSNESMLELREKGGKEQMEELIEIDQADINGARFVDDES